MLSDSSVRVVLSGGELWWTRVSKGGSEEGRKWASKIRKGRAGWQLFLAVMSWSVNAKKKRGREKRVQGLRVGVMDVVKEGGWTRPKNKIKKEKREKEKREGREQNKREQREGRRKQRGNHIIKIMSHAMGNATDVYTKWAGFALGAMWGVSLCNFLGK